METRTIDMTPTWAETAVMLVRILENGSAESKAFARSEILRMGQIIDQNNELAKLAQVAA